MSKLDKHLVEKEKIYIEGGTHTIVHLPAILCFVFTMMFLLPFVAQYNSDDPSRSMPFLVLSLIFFAGMVFFVVYGLLLRGANLYAMTNRRVLLKNGIFQRQLVEIPLQEVESIQIEQGSIGKLINFGTLVVARKNDEPESVPLISRPEHCLAVSNQVMEKFAQAYERAMQRAANQE
jgi:uncharacterized membrane protein YdbT with pleckstrin-like domain